MANGILLTTDEEIDAAIEASKFLPPPAMAAEVEYLRESRILLITLKSGRRLPLPVEERKELMNATDEELSKFEILGPGTAIHFPLFGGNLYVPYVTKTLMDEYNYEPLSPEIEASIDQALEDAKYVKPGPAVIQVNYLPGINAVAVHINTGQRLLIPAEDLQYVSSANPMQLEETEIVGRGEGIGFPELDAHFSLKGLLEGGYGNKKWMEKLEAKRAASLTAAA